MSGDEGFYYLVGQPFQVTAYQLAAALHYPCPLRGCASSARPWEHCVRATSLVGRARSLLERASEEQVVPKLRSEAPVPVAHFWDRSDPYVRRLWEEEA